MCKENIPVFKLDDIIGKIVDVENMTTPDGDIIGKIYTTDKNIKYSVQDKSIFEVKDKISIGVFNPDGVLSLLNRNDVDL